MGGVSTEKPTPSASAAAAKAAASGAFAANNSRNAAVSPTATQPPSARATCRDTVPESLVIYCSAMVPW